MNFIKRNNEKSDHLITLKTSDLILKISSKILAVKLSQNCKVGKNGFLKLFWKLFAEKWR